MFETEMLFRVGEQYGWLAALAVAAVTVMGKVVNRWMDNRYPPKEASEASELQYVQDGSSLHEHRLFLVCNYWNRLGIDRIPFPEKYPIRSEMYRDMLKILISTMTEHLEANIKELSSADSNADWQRKATDTLSKAVADYEHKFRDQGIPEIVIERFRSWNVPALGFITHTIGTLEESQIATDHRYKTSAMLSTVLGALKTAFYDAERTLIGLNGQLTGQNYRGKEVE
ncbi:hypothetical protein [Idiomarina aminovorans]|uniref:hypothetical protein n=1 Tax=Idiomarina aminovorans TaxID=2914829 RepID=UPI0020043AA0|nr:hypothetical protein [Idiomarina sp. ATCH4]MCK7458484.1 hypothetical protein [Idiomarina sp. ATCH4]